MHTQENEIQREAERLAKKFRRLIDSIPGYLTVTVTNDYIAVSETEAYNRYVGEHGHAEDSPLLAFETHHCSTLVGNSDNL